MPIKMRGFTLLEMILTITLIGIMAGVGAQILGNGVQVYEATSSSIETLNKTRYTMGRLVREIRETRYQGGSYDISAMTANQLTFTKRDGETVTISAALPLVTMGYASLGVTATLTDQVNAFSLAYYMADAVSPASSGADIGYVDVLLNLDSQGTIYPRRLRIALRDKPL